jgi:hypothetical protein
MEREESRQIGPKAGYYVYSTVVPAIVPNNMLRQVSKSVCRNYCYPMMGGDLGKEKNARYIIGKNSASSGMFDLFFESAAPIPLQTTFLSPCLYLSLFGL